MRWLAPAKINLSLRVHSRRADGFHELTSLMVPVSVFDELEVEVKDHGDLEFHCSDAGVPSDDTNLVVRAARLFCETFGILPQLRIWLRKEIPHGAGLGGGSSDAATTLLALNHLFQTELDRSVLSSLAAEIGSDVPFFIYQSAARVGGRGEFVEPLGGLNSVPLLLVKPPFGVSTPWAFQHWKDAREIPGVPYQEQRSSAGLLVNDLEVPVFQKYLLLADMKSWLLAQPETEAALMSGSGSTLFAVLRERGEGYALGERLAQEFGPQWWAYLCETMP